MIDIHSHVLYGVDDGARTLEDSVAMVRMAAEFGTTDLVCTPHSNLHYFFDPQVIAQRLEEIRQAANVPVRLYSGCDFHLSYDNIQDALENPQKYTIDHKGYLLVEFSDLQIFHNTAEIFARLQEAGMIPVITHPERNELLRQRIDQMAQWVETGARVQITAQSVTGEFGKRAKAFCETLLARGLVHFVASDAHDCEHRPPRLDLAREWLARQYGEPLAAELCVENPRAVLEGRLFEPRPIEEAPEPRKWYQLWR